MKKVVVAGRNDAGKSTVVGEIYRGLKLKGYQPLAVGSGVQDEKPYLFKGIDPTYVAIAIPDSGRDVADDIERVLRSTVTHIKERNQLILRARKALEELNKIRSVLELGNLSQRDIPPVSTVPDVALIESVGISDGYKAADGRELGEILVSVVPADIKSEIIMEQGNRLLDEADIVVVTKIDQAHRSQTSSTLKLLQRFFRYKPIIPVVATDGVHTDLLVDEVVKRLLEPSLLLAEAEKNRVR